MHWDLRPANVRNNADGNSAQVNTTNDPQDDNNTSDEAATVASDADVPIAETTDDMTVKDCGDPKSIRKAAHTFLLGYGLKAGNKKPNIKDHLDLRSLDRNKEEFKKMQTKFR